MSGVDHGTLRISVIIASRNTRQLTVDCLASLAEAAPSRPYEIIVVDNASSDGTVDAIRTRFPQVRIIECQENLGLAQANNLGAAEASGELMLFLNSDTLVPPQALSRLAAPFEADPRIGIAAPRLVRPDGRVQGTASFLMTPLTVLLPTARRRAKKAIGRAVQGSGSLAGIAYFCGAAVMVRREAFEAVGGFDPSFFFYCEDPDLCKRLADGGWDLAFVPETAIVHVGASSSKSIRIGADIERNRGRCHYIRKHFGPVPAAIVGFVLFFSAAAQAALNTLGVVVTAGLCRSFRDRALLNGAACLWFVLGLPRRERWIYRKLFGNWQKA